METHEQGEQRPVWSARELEHFEKRLLEERRRALIQMEQFGDVLGVSPTAADGELTNWPFHMADEGTDTFEQEQNFLLASREGHLLWHIDEALRRLYRSPERFGRCEDCAGWMSYERLDAIPYATHCIRCKQGWEGGRAD
jgi:RNA polymerase-binding transcription factor DksA